MTHIRLRSRNHLNGPRQQQRRARCRPSPWPLPWRVLTRSWVQAAEVGLWPGRGAAGRSRCQSASDGRDWRCPIGQRASLLPAQTWCRRTRAGEKKGWGGRERKGEDEGTGGGEGVEEEGEVDKVGRGQRGARDRRDSESSPFL